MAGVRRGHYRFDEAPAPQQQQASGPEQGVLVEREEQAVAGGSGAASGAAEPLEERGHATRRVDLDDSVESPTSIPSSKVEVETMTQSRASANACSAIRRSSSESEVCERNVVTLQYPLRRRASLFSSNEPTGAAHE